MSARRGGSSLVLARVLLGLALGVGSGACDEPEDAPIGGTDTEGLAPCDEQPVITYDTFGRGFLSTYCDGCHGSAVDDRQGAPDDVVFDTREDAADWADRILARVAPDDGSGPTMPPVGGITPQDVDRVVVWLTCGAQ